MTTLAETRAILADLVAFPTVSADSNLELIAYASDRLSTLGANLSLSLDETGAKANLLATFGDEADGGIVLSGHTDVVPVDGQDWQSDPFELVERDGRFHGRGACDMKGFIAACLAMAPRFANASLTRPLHLAFTYDEEVGCLGARALMRELDAAAFRPAVAIIGEPTDMRVVEGHKGCHEYTTLFSGLEGHGSRPELGVNAAEYAARFVVRLLEIGEEVKARAPVASRFVPPWTTLQVGRIAGGSARNVIAGQCEVEWEVRTARADDLDFVKNLVHAYVDKVLEPEMKAVHGDAGIRTVVVGEIDGLEVAELSEARDIVMELTGQDAAGVVPFGTEAGLFQARGMSAVICGPGSIAQAHKPDEYVETTQLQACLDMLEGLCARMSR